MWRAELRGNDRGRVFFSFSPPHPPHPFFFLIQVEGAAQECSSGSESRHPDGRQMLENISEQHVHFSRGGSSKYTQTLPQSLHTRGDREEEGLVFFLWEGVGGCHVLAKRPSPARCSSADGCAAVRLDRTAFNETLSRTASPRSEPCVPHRMCPLSFYRLRT